MRAVQFFEYGDASMLKIVDVDTPAPTAGQVLVRVSATSVNPVDIAVRRGEMRMLSGHRFPQGLGIDIAGVVAEVGANVTAFVPGDRVWGVKAGLFTRASGAAAEFMVIDARLLSSIPANIDLIDSAALPAVGVTAVTAVGDKARVVATSRVLIRGAAGGVGSAAVQYAHSLGAHVTALASERNMRFVLDLGADVALNRATTPVVDLGDFDAIIDTVGSELLQLRRHLSPNGRMVTIAVGSLGSIAAVAFSAIYGPRRIRAFFGQPPRGVLAQLTEIVQAEGIMPVIEEIYPLERIADAHRAAEAGGGRGKRVIRIGV
ncbi:NADPH:quinone reductase-like Zn-dependent oxidoreductase [Homoserinimonas aerilata]|uniref:NADPH:quinone reductase-like Zn-dependent oxidoreductase n=1 Tax=Homoserinimonas aerilata TaxID=1162970 RepID=A0A542Y1K7_9MICO|nr:NADP-dependent oxidoreductase [Homoserinimonas aerilata]TQL41950.1 NADPH:quinone reductase-like Zn-dependent oxidoreductase [Homoserinimonas aerilata]